MTATWAASADAPVLQAALTAAALEATSDGQLEGAPPAPDADGGHPVIVRPHYEAPLPVVLPARHLRIAAIGGLSVLDVVPFDEHGYMRPHDFAAIDHAFRAPTNDCTIPIHPHLIEVLMQLSAAFEDQPLVLVSGHREPTHGTRTTSYHVSGRAADVAIQGVRSLDLYRAALRLDVPGVGYYGTFVHVDVRDDEPPYHWSRGHRWRRHRH
ncbi:MAG: DUF882 domain-containing protein [Deltaproteobacteria bacterium]|jgi:hypothetical protein|nr:DUF882 domain-containing protein [Deltaproteobacteria bacterium]MBW2537359.1 DUF882 domain-containing protein [Deltaproteobacteria bacterium]